jgi:hypothetical protein
VGLAIAGAKRPLVLCGIALALGPGYLFGLAYVGHRLNGTPAVTAPRAP